MPLEAVVADANVLLSAVIGKAAQRIFSEQGLKVHVSEFNAGEVSEYLPLMAGKYALPLNLVVLRWRLLPFMVHPVSTYAGHYERALGDLGDRDPEDAHALALARALSCPLWSNDRHLARFEVPCYTTARLLRLFEMRK
ncbi:MAG: hypothetical protein A2Y69_06040 [Candidatus Aminicenantes bacterium RBG_13_59_9]|nr:MAG: hypothetical protein A2Y69_06040 [Candidatus Aminicenantes bacterium RBG_13_59_9]